MPFQPGFPVGHPLGDALAGVIEGAPSGAIATWSAAVKKKGAVVTRMPSGPNRGKLVARYGKKSPFKYVLASPGALAEDARDDAQNAAAIQAGSSNLAAAKTAIRETVQAAVKEAAIIPRTAVTEALGIPGWAFPVLAVGAGALVLTRLFPPAGAVPRDVYRSRLNGYRRRDRDMARLLRGQNR